MNPHAEHLRTIAGTGTMPANWRQWLWEAAQALDGGTVTVEVPVPVEVPVRVEVRMPCGDMPRHKDEIFALMRDEEIKRLGLVRDAVMEEGAHGRGDVGRALMARGLSISEAGRVMGTGYNAAKQWIKRPLRRESGGGGGENGAIR